MASEQVISEIRKRYQYKQVVLGSLDKIFVPRHTLFASPNVYHIVQFYYALHAQTMSDTQTNVLLSASTTEEALEKGVKVRPEVLVIDKYLPPRGGYDFYFRLEAELKEQCPPALLLLPPGDNSPIQRPRFGLIYLYRGLYNPVALVQSVRAITARHAFVRQAPRPPAPMPLMPAPLAV